MMTACRQRMSRDERFREYEQAALDWLFGANPWGVPMVIGYPAPANSPRSPHSIVAQRLGVGTQLGGLVEGPVYGTTTEPMMDGAANIPYLLAARTRE